MKFRIRFRVGKKWHEVGRNQYGYMTEDLEKGMIFDSFNLIHGISAAYVLSDEDGKIELVPAE